MERENVENIAYLYGTLYSCNGNKFEYTYSRQVFVLSNDTFGLFIFHFLGP